MTDDTWCCNCDVEDVDVVRDEITAGPNRGKVFTVCKACWRTGWCEPLSAGSSEHNRMVATIVRAMRHWFGEPKGKP